MTTGEMTQEGRFVPWWLVLIQGIFSLILGVLFLTDPAMTTAVAVQFLGIYWLISGMFQIVAIFIDRSQWGWKLFMGIVGIYAGLYIVQHPLLSTLLVPASATIVLGVIGLVYGVIGVVAAFRGAGWGAGILGVLSVLLGIWLLAHTAVAAISLPFALGILLIVGGIVGVVQAFRMR